MTSDFTTARLHLDRAQNCLCGTDETSRQARVALDLLLEALATAEYTKPRGQVLAFRLRTDGRQR